MARRTAHNAVRSEAPACSSSTTRLAVLLWAIIVVWAVIVGLGASLLLPAMQSLVHGGLVIGILVWQEGGDPARLIRAGSALVTVGWRRCC